MDRTCSHLAGAGHSASGLASGCRCKVQCAGSKLVERRGFPVEFTLGSVGSQLRSASSGWQLVGLVTLGKACHHPLPVAANPHRGLRAALTDALSQNRSSRSEQALAEGWGRLTEHDPSNMYSSGVLSTENPGDVDDNVIPS